MTQSELAQRVDVSQQTIARWESMKSEIPITSLRKISVVFGCSLNDLIHLEDEFASTLRAVTKLRKEVFGYSNREPDMPWGTVRVEFLGYTENLSVPIDFFTYEDFGGFVRELSCDYDGFISFSTLDNRVIILNAKYIRELVFIDDNVEAMPHYYHAEIYRALTEMDLDYDSDKMAEIDAEAAKRFEDVDKRESIAEIATLVDVEGNVNTVISSKETYNGVFSLLSPEPKVFIPLEEREEGMERLIRADRVLFASMPLVKYQILFADDIKNNEDYPY
jgi:transcriptional regulator with XRE-family HTH domain